MPKWCKIYSVWLKPSHNKTNPLVVFKLWYWFKKDVIFGLSGWFKKSCNVRASSNHHKVGLDKINDLLKVFVSEIGLFSIFIFMNFKSKPNEFFNSLGSNKHSFDNSKISHSFCWACLTCFSNHADFPIPGGPWIRKRLPIYRSIVVLNNRWNNFNSFSRPRKYFAGPRSIIMVRSLVKIRQNTLMIGISKDFHSG